MERIAKDGTIRVGVADEKPFGYVDTDGRIKGAIPEVIAALLAPHGIRELKAEIVEFNALIPGINAVRFDIIGASMYIRPARCEAILFTNPVARTGAGFAVLKGNPKGVKSIAAVAAHTNALVGTATGSANVEDLAEAGVPNKRVVLFANATEALAGLKAGRCDVIYFPALELNELLKTANDPSVERVEGFEQLKTASGESEYGYPALGLRKADADLKQALDAGIAELLSSGKLLEIVSRYGFGKDELPDGVKTAEQLCKP
ncbi:ectoine/hydroxyectoine ABC transporter substrate-binding protein EhuB [Mesorhizobium australicum]